MIIQPLPGYKKPANTDSIRRPKKKLDQIQEAPAEPEPHSPELDAALAAVTELNAGLDNTTAKSDAATSAPSSNSSSSVVDSKSTPADDKGGDSPVADDSVKSPTPRLIDDVARNAGGKKPVSVKLDASDMMNNIKSDHNQTKQPGLEPTGKSDEASLADIEKNIVQAVEDDLGFSDHHNMKIRDNSDEANNVQADKSAKTDNSNDNAKSSHNDTTSQVSAPAKVTPPKPRKMQSLFSVKDFAKPEPPTPVFESPDNSADDMSDDNGYDDDILSSSNGITDSAVPLNRPANRVVNRPNSLPTLDGISDNRQNQLLSSMGYGRAEGATAGRRRQPSPQVVPDANIEENLPEPVPAVNRATAATPQSQNVAAAVQTLPTTAAQGGFVVTRPKARVDFLAVIGVPFGAVALLTAIMPFGIVFSLGIIYISLLLTIPVMALIGLVFGIVALIKDIKQPQALNKIIAIVSIVLAVASAGVMMYRSSSFGSSLGSSLTGSSTTVNSDSSPD